MFDPLLAEYGLGLLLAAGAVMLLAGFTKGAVGFALPMVAISGIGSLMPPTVAIAALIVPSLVTNLWQAGRDGVGEALRSFWRFRVLNAVLFVVIALSAQLVAVLPDAWLFLILGTAVTGFASLQLAGWRLPSPPPHQVRRVELGVGCVAGFFGGLAGVWGPPILFYLLAQGLQKIEQVRVQGIAFLIGSIVLATAHLRSGVLSAETVPLSVAMVLPAVLGMGLGLWLQDRLDEARFRRLTLAVLVLAGLNLLRRGLF